MNEFEAPLRPSRKTLVLSLLGLAAFLAVEALLIRHYLRVDARPPSREQALQLQIALDYSAAKTPPSPPAYYRALAAVAGSGGPGRAAPWVNWGYMALLALSLFAVSWRFLPDARALAATLAFCAAPGLQDLLISPLPDLAQAALVVACYWALLEGDGFTFWVPSLAFGAIFGAGMLHKWSFFAYLLPGLLIGARGLGDRSARLKVLAAAALAAAVCGPWYAAHATQIPAWLARGWAETGASFWKDGAWGAYLGATVGQVGPLLWVIGLLSMLAPQYVRRRENAWILGYWVLVSCAFWTLAPDRQLRCFLPALAPLGLALAATWPRGLTWGVTAVQLVCALNFFFGLAGPFQIPTPLVPMTFLQNRPPAREDWKLAEILARIEADRDPSRPFSPVTLVADDEYFNPVTIGYLQKALSKPHALFRAPDARLSELSEFLLLRQGRDPLPGALGDAAAAVADPNGWFVNAYDARERWQLPDGGTAVLYRQKRSRPRPAGSQRLTYAYFEAGKTQARGVTVDLGAWDAAASLWPVAMVSADRVDGQGVTVRGVTADLRNFTVHPFYEGGRGDFDWNDMRVLRLDRVVLRSVQLDAAELKKLIEKRVPGLTLAALSLEGTAKLAGSWKGRAVTMEAALDFDREGNRLHVRVLSAGYMGFAIPPALFAPVTELDFPLGPTPERPFFLDIPGVSLRGDRLTVP